MMTMMMTHTTATAATDGDATAVYALRLEALVSELCARGYRALYSSRKGVFLFSRDASTTAPIVAAANTGITHRNLSRAPPILEMRQRFKTIQKVRLAPS
jgi:hypothetical protein